MNNDNSYASWSRALSFLINTVSEKQLIELVKETYNFRKLIDEYNKDKDSEEKQFLGEIIWSISKFSTLNEVKDMILKVLKAFKDQGLGQIDVSIFLRLLHTI